MAAFLYRYDRLPDLFASLKDQFVFVFDFGGGTCDVSLIGCTPGKLPVVVARQVGHFGGEKIEDLIVQRWLVRAPRESTSILQKLSPDAWLTLRTSGAVRLRRVLLNTRMHPLKRLDTWGFRQSDLEFVD